jgi:hypothetical protein
MFWWHKPHKQVVFIFYLSLKGVLHWFQGCDGLIDAYFTTLFGIGFLSNDVHGYSNCLMSFSWNDPDDMYIWDFYVNVLS